MGGKAIVIISGFLGPLLTGADRTKKKGGVSRTPRIREIVKPLPANSAVEGARAGGKDENKGRRDPSCIDLKHHWDRGNFAARQTCDICIATPRQVKGA